MEVRTEEGNTGFSMDFDSLSQQFDDGTLKVADPDVTDPTPQPHAKAAEQVEQLEDPATVVEKEEVAAVITAAPQTAELDPKETTAKIAGVLTPDGRTIIPYGELATARQRASDAQAALDEANRRILEMSTTLNAQTQQLAALAVAKPSDPVAARAADIAARAQETGDLGAAIEEGLAEVDAEASWLGAALRKTLAPIIAQANRAGALEQELATFRAAHNQREQREQLTAAQQVDEVIANMPIVDHWRANAGENGSAREAFEEAVRIDTRLRSHPEWKDKSIADRFSEVQRRVVVALGPEAVPESLRKFIPELTAPKTDVKEKGRAALAAAPGALSSLSDIPGGHAAAAGVGDALDKGELTNGQLEDLMLGRGSDFALQVFGRQI